MNILLLELRMELDEEPGDEVVGASGTEVPVELGAGEVGAAPEVMAGPGGVGDVLDATVGAVNPEDGREVMLCMDNEVMLSADVKEDMKLDC